MARTIRQDAEAIGSDSFLDVVTNIVGILIILVMVVGIRIKNLPAQAAVDQDAAKAEVTALAREAESLERDMLGLEDQVRSVTFTAQARFQERGTLAYLLAEHEREINEVKKSLDAQTRTAFDMQRALSAAEHEANRLEQAKTQASQIKKRKPIQIKSYPTPISHTVYGNEVYFQLSGGRLTFVPFEDLNGLTRDDAVDKYSRDPTADVIEGEVGPRQGFRAQYVILREANGAAYEEIVLLPVAENLGEPIEEAFKESSQFRTRLAQLRSRQTTVTLWTYPDSFVDYARVKELLYTLGFSVAGRPMMAGMPIGGSSTGSRSAAQ
ncbi:MAG TPA: hypothetical protein VJ783_13960 [Pirellulales bacterium]|nr:hypothetical protein [Pirellulales bacterium]